MLFPFPKLALLFNEFSQLSVFVLVAVGRADGIVGGAAFVGIAGGCRPDGIDDGRF